MAYVYWSPAKIWTLNQMDLTEPPQLGQPLALFDLSNSGKYESISAGVITLLSPWVKLNGVIIKRPWKGKGVLFARYFSSEIILWNMLNPSNAKATLGQIYNKNTKIFEHHLNPVMLVFIAE